MIPLLSRQMSLDQAGKRLGRTKKAVLVDLHGILTQDLHRKLTHPKGC
ncbi:hypothetical protein [Ralstonia solanacearum]|nr:hypothetical protein [Ralstonia solanacearum]